MAPVTPVDKSSFRRILTRNIAFPLVFGLINMVVFVVLIVFLLSALKWVEHTELVLGKANQLARYTVDMQSGMRGYLVTGNNDFLRPYREAKPKISMEIDALKELMSDNPMQVERVGHIEALFGEWQNYAEEAIAMRRSNGNYQDMVAARGLLEFNEIRDEFAALENTEQMLLTERRDSARLITTISVVTYLIVNALITGLLSFFGRRELVQLSDTYTESLLERQQHSEQLEQQAWLRSGQVGLAEKSTGQPVLQLLGRSILDFLAQYVNVSVAALYTRNPQTGHLERVATYGFDKNSEQVTQSYQDGESLVEQALFSRRTIHINDVPDNYLKVNSGLGNSSPRHIILLPIHHDDNINGVLELGFLQKPSERDLSLLNLIAPNVGNSIEMALNRRRLQDMLEGTQQLNEELQVQQEELRTANEELEEQSRVLEESQALLENQKAELEQTNEQLLEQADSLDQKNSALNTIQLELEARAEDLARASKYKSEFLANMSHELRTPLNSSMILAKLLAENQKGNLTDEQIQFSQSIYSAGNDLLNLINDILDISKVEAGKLELLEENVSVQRLGDALRMTFEPLALQKQLKLHVTVDAIAPASIITDHQRVEQILKNLLSNAIKFTDAGEVSLTITSGAKDKIVFSVIDSGIGIAPEQQGIIFEAFQQADGSINRRFGGTGLGLSISRDLAVLLGGSISVRSTPGVGSTFSLTLPLVMPDSEATPEVAPAAAVVSAAPAAPIAVPVAAPMVKTIKLFADDRGLAASKSRAVLVVEDDQTFARVLFDLAHELGYRCLVAQNAAEALELANDFLPDAILLDIGLPDISGMSVLQKLKTNSLTRHIPVHIMSAADRTEAALQLGAIGYMMKPATRERIKEVFQKLEDKLTQKVKRVLLVEDDALQRQSVSLLIGDDDVEITAVEFGEDAIKLLRTTIFDCMIIDLKLPDMQGHELLQRLSNENIYCFPPVIVYTGRNLTRAEEAELLKYSRSIIIKGARSPERLLDEVTLFLHKVEAELSVDRQSMLKTVRSRDQALENRRILLVDDDMRNIFALTGALEQKGALVSVARNGFEAISKLDEVSDIDLVLMDVMMPGMDGLEATRRIRSDARFQKLPIIAVTAKAMKDDQEQCIQAGASDYLAKPIDIDRLYSLLRVWMPTMGRS